MAEPYVPISCARHSGFERAVMRRHPLHLVWVDAAGVEHEDTVLPLAVFTRAGEEFLLVRDADGRSLDLRLDRIRTDPPG